MSDFNQEFDNTRIELHNLLRLCCSDDVKFNASKIIMEGILSRTHKAINDKNITDEDD